MATQRAMYSGVENILDAFQSYDNPYFSVWSNRDMLFSNNNSDITQATARLTEMLRAAEQNGNSDILAIKFHPDKEAKWITDKTPVIGTLFVRAVDLENGKVAGVDDKGFLPYPMYKAMQVIEALPATISAKLDTFEQRIAAMENGSLGATDQPQTGLEIAMSLLQNPAISQLVGQLIPGLLGSILPGLKLPAIVPQNMQVAGVEAPTGTQPFSISQADAAKLENALARLGPHCDLVNDITALADLAETKPELFKMLLGNLKNL